jgi:CO dehydrogenase maturation factor
MDMEAGIEHLGRGTAQAVDKLLVVVEPGRRSIDTAEHIRHLAEEIGLRNIAVIGNKVRGSKDEDFLRKHLSDLTYLGSMPYDEALIEADLAGQSPYETAELSKKAVSDLSSKL